MPFYPVMPPDVTSSVVEDAALASPAGCPVRRDLASPCRRGLGRRPDGAWRPGLAGSGPGTWWSG